MQKMYQSFLMLELEIITRARVMYRYRQGEACNAGVEPFFLFLLRLLVNMQNQQGGGGGESDAHLALLSDGIIKADSLCFLLRRSLLGFFLLLLLLFPLLSPPTYATYGPRTIVKTTDEYTMKKREREMIILIGVCQPILGV